MRKLTLILFILLFSSFAYAFPENTTIQGVLRDTNTGEFLNGTYPFTITFYNLSNDAQLLTDDTNLSVRNGTWNYNIPITTNIFTQDAYFVLEANGDTFPATPISSTPYAWMCHTATNADSLGGQSSAYYLNTDSKIGNTTIEIWSVIDNSTFAYANEIIDYDNDTIQRTYDTVTSNWNRSGTNTFLANTDDMVGIGTTDPQQTLHVNGTGTTITKIQSMGQVAGFQVETSLGNWAIGMVNSDAIRFYEDSNSANTYLYVESGGNVAIGKATTNFALDVDGEVNSTAVRTERVYLNATYGFCLNSSGYTLFGELNSECDQ